MNLEASASSHSTLQGEQLSFAPCKSHEEQSLGQVNCPAAIWGKCLLRRGWNQTLASKHWSRRISSGRFKLRVKRWHSARRTFKFVRKIADQIMQGSSVHGLHYLRKGHLSSHGKRNWQMIWIFMWLFDRVSWVYISQTCVTNRARWVQIVIIKTKLKPCSNVAFYMHRT